VIREVEGVPLLEAKLPGPFRAAFTTRIGGESKGAYASLNLSLRNGDDPDAVERNRARVAGLIGRQLVSPLQVHGLRVAGAAEYLQQAPETPCDGLTIHADIDRGLAALLLFADCVPVVLCGEVDMAVVHGGWRGILGGIVQQAGRAMMGMPGTAVIGPSIGPCCFAVDDELGEAFAHRFGHEVVLEPGSRSAGRNRVDLWAAVTKAALELGIHPNQVVNPRLCTFCNNDLFYSHRAEGELTGRHGCLGWAAL
jgi:YfiH family protein